MFRKFLMTAVVAVAVLLTAASDSRAGFAVVLDPNFASPTLAGSGRIILDRVGGAAANADDDQSGVALRIALGNSNDQIPSTYNGFAIFLTATSSSPNAAADSIQTTTNIRITNTSNSTRTLVLLAGDDTFTAPGNGGFVIKNAITLVSATNLVALRSYAAATSNLAQTPDAVVPSETPVAVVTSTNWTRSGAPGTFSLATVITLTLGSGGIANFQTSLDVLNAAPAPAGLLLAAFGIPAFGLLRRFGRKSAEVAVVA